jgi:hypothetical protein
MTIPKAFKLPHDFIMNYSKIDKSIQDLKEKAKKGRTTVYIDKEVMKDFTKLVGKNNVSGAFELLAKGYLEFKKAEKK